MNSCRHLLLNLSVPCLLLKQYPEQAATPPHTHTHGWVLVFEAKTITAHYSDGAVTQCSAVSGTFLKVNWGERVAEIPDMKMTVFSDTVPLEAGGGAQ